MTKHRVTQIRDLQIILRDMERYVKDPSFLRVGREFTNFSLRPREVWANWLMCVVANNNNGNDNLTFAEDPTGGDGVILDKETGILMLTEHVFIPPPQPGDGETVEQLMMNAVHHKMQSGRAYAEGKHLIIFSEAIGPWHPNRVARGIEGAHAFESVFAMCLQRQDDNRYRYGVTRFVAPPENSPAWSVDIDRDFTSWRVDRVQ